MQIKHLYLLRDGFSLPDNPNYTFGDKAERTINNALIEAKNFISRDNNIPSNGLDLVNYC